MKRDLGTGPSEKTIYILRAWIDGGNGGEDEWELEELPTKEELEEKLRRWFLGGDWDRFEGTVHEVGYEIREEFSGEDEEPLEEGTFHFRVPFNEKKLMRQALNEIRSNDPDIVFLSSVAEECGHEWERSVDIDGGCDSNPGVWAGPGDRLYIREHCTKCGLQRREVLEGGETVELKFFYDPKVTKRIWGVVKVLLERDLTEGADERLLLKEYLRKYPWHGDKIQKFFAKNAADPGVADLLDSPYREQLLARLLHET
jgi:hypothetical protein